MKNLWKKLRILMGIIVAMGSFPLAAMEVPSKNDKNQLCGIDKLVFNRWVVDQATEEFFGNTLCIDIKNKISSLEFDLIYLFKFPIPSADQLVEFVNYFKNKKPSVMHAVLHKNIVYHMIDYKINGLKFYLESHGYRNQIYPTILDGNINLKDVKIGEGQIPDSYYILIDYQNNHHPDFGLYCQIPYLYKENDTPFYIHDLCFYMTKPENMQLKKTKNWKIYKKSDYELREFHKLIPLKKSLSIEYTIKNKKEKNKKTFGGIISHFSQQKKEVEKKKETNDSHPEDFCLYFLRK